MDGYVAVTDPGWYQRLSREPGPRDANFWRPSTRRVGLAPGTPFLFKLKAPHNAVAGFGFLASFTILPDWLAWETFGTANGVDTLEDFRARLSRIQRGADIEADPDGRIGCCLIAEARFFAEKDWVRAPADWKPHTQSGERTDLSTGEGLRVWQECLARSPIEPCSVEVANEDSPRYGSATLVLPRLGQGIFRVHVLDAYGRSCAVTEEHSLPVLEAVHIKPYASGGPHAVSNGLSLRADLHKLFDRGYVTVDEQRRFVVGKRLKHDFENGRAYYALNGHSLKLPTDSRCGRRRRRWGGTEIMPFWVEEVALPVSGAGVGELSSARHATFRIRVRRVAERAQPSGSPTTRVIPEP